MWQGMVGFFIVYFSLEKRYHTFFLLLFNLSLKTPFLSFKVMKMRTLLFQDESLIMFQVTFTCLKKKSKMVNNYVKHIWILVTENYKLSNELYFITCFYNLGLLISNSFRIGNFPSPFWLRHYECLRNKSKAKTLKQ